MEGLSRADASTALNLLAEAAAARQEEFAQFDNDPDRTDTDEEIESDSPIMDQFFAEGGAEAVLQMTNFSLVEFNGVWQIVSAPLEHV